MILVDTSVWAEHLRSENRFLRRLLEEKRVRMHTFVLGELACGNLKRREATLDHLRSIPEAVLADHADAFHVLESRRLWGTGVGWIDVHLLASALITPCLLWTLDQSLNTAARALKISYQPA